MGNSEGLMIVPIIFLLCDGRIWAKKNSKYANASLRAILVDLEV